MSEFDVLSALTGYEFLDLEMYELLTEIILESGAADYSHGRVIGQFSLSLKVPVPYSVLLVCKLHEPVVEGDCRWREKEVWPRIPESEWGKKFDILDKLFCQFIKVHDCIDVHCRFLFKHPTFHDFLKGVKERGCIFFCKGQTARILMPSEAQEKGGDGTHCTVEVQTRNTSGRSFPHAVYHREYDAGLAMGLCKLLRSYAYYAYRPIFFFQDQGDPFREAHFIDLALGFPDDGLFEVLSLSVGFVQGQEKGIGPFLFGCDEEIESCDRIRYTSCRVDSWDDDKTQTVSVDSIL
jgi:hypothetical protein